MTRRLATVALISPWTEANCALRLPGVCRRRPAGNVTALVPRPQLPRTRMISDRLQPIGLDWPLLECLLPRSPSTPLGYRRPSAQESCFAYLARCAKEQRRVRHLQDRG